MSAPFLYEFLFRGGDPATGAGGAWHIRIAQSVALPGEAAHVVIGGALTPEQAAAAGFPLPTVLAAINAEALAQVASLNGSLAAKTAKMHQMVSDAAGLKTDLEQAKVEQESLRHQLASRKASHAGVRAAHT